MKYLVYFQTSRQGKKIYNSQLGDYVVFYVPDEVEEDHPYNSNFVAMYFDLILFDPLSLNEDSALFYGRRWSLIGVVWTRRNVESLIGSDFRTKHIVWHLYKRSKSWKVDWDGVYPRRTMSARQFFEDLYDYKFWQMINPRGYRKSSSNSLMSYRYYDHDKTPDLMVMAPNGRVAFVSDVSIEKWTE